MSTSFGVVLLGTGSSLPPRSIRNSDFPASLDTSDEWIRSRTGILERRIAAPSETSASLGLTAARRALEAAQLHPADVDMIICATVTSDMMVPSNACVIQGGLGCRPIPAFDVNAACTGFLYGLAVAAQFIRTGSCRHILVVGAETLSRVVDFSDRTTCVLFGDGAGAVVVGAANGQGRGQHWFRLCADGGRGDYIRLNGVRLRVPASSPADPRASDEFDYLRMNGREVFKFAVRTIIELVGESLAECNSDAGRHRSGDSAPGQSAHHRRRLRRPEFSARQADGEPGSLRQHLGGVDPDCAGRGDADRPRRGRRSRAAHRLRRRPDLGRRRVDDLNAECRMQNERSRMKKTGFHSAFCILHS